MELEICHLELELSGCNKEVSALHSDHCTHTGSTALAKKKKKPFIDK